MLQKARNDDWYHQFVLRNIFVIAKETDIKKGVPIIETLTRSVSYYDCHPISFSTGDGVWLKIFVLISDVFSNNPSV